MKDIILSLVFSAPLLIIMVYPSIKIVEFIEQKTNLNDKLYTKLTVGITILLSVITGFLLKFV
jgi:hypothetical protein